LISLVIINDKLNKHGEFLTTALSLPASDKELQLAAINIKLDKFNKIDYHYTDYSFNKLPDMDKELICNTDIYELNLLAYKLSELNESELLNYEALITDRANVTGIDLINIAYQLDESIYTILFDVHDLDDLGRWYTNEQSPDLPVEIFDNIDFEDVGYDLQATENGVLTSVGYIRNFYEKFEPNYDGTNLYKLITEAREQHGKSIQITNM